MTTRSSIWGRDPCFSICFWTICDQTRICTRSESTLIQVIEAWPLIVKYKQKTVKSFLDSDIKIIKSMRPSFEKLNNPRFCSTLERVDLSEKANYNCQFKPLVDRFYSELKIKIISTKSFYSKNLFQSWRAGAALGANMGQQCPQSVHVQVHAGHLYKLDNPRTQDGRKIWHQLPLPAEHSTNTINRFPGSPIQDQELSHDKI